ncbi:outer membrane beta-barrel protein [Mangrovibacterium marinum]|uniref:Outer membrane protein with beta-barrel domain n=1 Tax=Mangrovibacterium marinum TaxID=1639118 RepID=A0A2T5C0S9_9BACT|nr:outer membrane beta-barrel protein [Mangrovibacterium marinum]PTN08191.1 outer membrane protein with beta-barrel domain [Mangrovibacterium marinum]
MKGSLLFKSICFSLLTALATNSLAQSRVIRNSGFYYTLEAGAGYGLKMKTDYWAVDIKNDFSPFNFGAKATANIFLNDFFSVGAGLAYSEYRSPQMRTLPVTANIKLFATKQARSAFVYVDGGYAMRTDADKQHKGPLYEAGVGYRLPLRSRRDFLMFKLGYSYFKTKHWEWAPPPPDEEYPNGHTFFDGSTPQRYYLERPAIAFSICFYHSTR